MLKRTLDWHPALAEMIRTMDGPRFAPVLARALRQVAPYDYTVMFGYRSEERPLDLYDDFGRDKRDIFVTMYQAGPYLLDPFFHASRSNVAPGLYRMRDLAPDRFYQSEYYRSYYVQTGLTEEIGFFLATGDGARVVISLMRAGHSPSFSARDMARLHAVAPVVIAAAERNWRDLAQRFDSSPGTRPAEATLGEAFAAFGRHRLTRREGEVVAMVLRGHSSEAIAVALKIAPGTVKIHRKNIYAKLGIGSQAELFSMFLASLSGGERPGSRAARRRA
ncbi:MAG TPA: helix-turn-helix transcriptional regulator [Dongiaceae bacterium]|jgi:DNA-binding CsgD family transcriptional regulator|nr:helix-turn-helix transcriptional regulator [Dongiaceae bacterium]